MARKHFKLDYSHDLLRHKVYFLQHLYDGNLEIHEKYYKYLIQVLYLVCF